MLRHYKMHMENMRKRKIMKEEVMAMHLTESKSRSQDFISTINDTYLETLLANMRESSNVILWKVVELCKEELEYITNRLNSPVPCNCAGFLSHVQINSGDFCIAIMNAMKEQGVRLEYD